MSCAHDGQRPQDLSVNVSSGMPSKLYKDGKLVPGALLEGGVRVAASGFPDADSVYRVRPGDMKQKLWCGRLSRSPACPHGPAKA